MSQTSVNQPKGPRLLRTLVIIGSVALSILVFWLLGFISDDIESLRGPDYADVEARHLDRAQVARARDLDRRIADLQNQQTALREKQAQLAESTSNSRETLNQLLEIQRVAVQKGMRPSETEQRAFLENQRQFLANQKQSQELTEQAGRLREEEKNLQAERREAEVALEVQRRAAHREHDALLFRHKWTKASLKLLALIPLALLVLWLVLKRRSSMYAPMFYAAGVAVALRLMQLIHEYFPERYFKYIALGAAIGIVVYALQYVLRMSTAPKQPWLLKQYREAYERFACPVCGYPIRRGPLKYAIWGRQGPLNPRPLESAAPPPDEEYSCPSCGTALFEKCAACQRVRHSLLPHCEKCGAAREIPALTKN